MKQAENQPEKPPLKQPPKQPLKQPVITLLLARASTAWVLAPTLLIALLMTLLARGGRLAREDRGDENIKVVIYAALAVTLGVAIAAAITAAVNGKLPLIR